MVIVGEGLVSVGLGKEVDPILLLGKEAEGLGDEANLAHLGRWD